MIASFNNQTGKLNRLPRQFYAFAWATKSYAAKRRYRPLISVILPAYNQADYLEDSVLSVLKQHTYPLELIIVDDGSSDHTTEVLSLFADDSRVKVIKQANQGIAAALNRGFSEAKGQFLTWTSADNLYRDNALQCLADFLIANPTIGLAYANVEIIDEDGKPFIDSGYRTPDQEKPGSSKLLLPIAANTLSDFGDNFVNACFLYRNEVKNLVGDYRSDCPGYEDYDYWLRTSLVTKLAHIDSDDFLYQYRLHRESLTATLNSRELSVATKASAEIARRNHKLVSGGLKIRIAPDHTELCTLLEASLKCLGHDVEIIEQKQVDSPRNGSAKALCCLWGEDREQSKTNTPTRLKVFRPQEFALELSYAHSTHKHCHSTWDISPFVVTTDCSDPKTAVPRGTLVLPPLSLPNIIRRARNSNFHAVTPEHDSRATALIFSPDMPANKDHSKRFEWKIDFMPRLIRECRNITFVLLCTNFSQRQAADTVNTKLGNKGSGNLRIVDLSSELQNTRHDEICDRLGRPLMFVLSSVDVILSLSGPCFDLDSLLELRCESGYGAMAGRAVFAICDNEPKPFSSQIESWSSGSENAIPKDPSYSLSSFAFSCPHLGLICMDRDKICEIPKNILEARHTVDNRSLEQWLEKQGVSDVGTRISSLFV